MAKENQNPEVKKLSPKELTDLAGRLAQEIYENVPDEGQRIAVINTIAMTNVSHAVRLREWP
jgi:hypothetical protein